MKKRFLSFQVVSVLLVMVLGFASTTSPTTAPSDGKRLVWASNRNGKAPHETNLFIADWVE